MDHPHIEEWKAMIAAADAPESFPKRPPDGWIPPWLTPEGIGAGLSAPQESAAKRHKRAMEQIEFGKRLQAEADRAGRADPVWMERQRQQKVAEFERRKRLVFRPAEVRRDDTPGQTVANEVEATRAAAEAHWKLITGDRQIKGEDIRTLDEAEALLARRLGAPTGLPTEETIRLHTTTVFGWMDRVRILFGRPVQIDSVVSVSFPTPARPWTLSEAASVPHVAPLFARRLTDVTKGAA